MFLEDSRVGKKGGPAIFKSLPFPKIKFLRNPNTWLRQQKNLPNFWQMVIGPWFWFLPTLPCALQNAFEYLWTTRVSKVFICNLEFEFYTNKLLLLHLWHSLLGVLTRISVHPVSPWHAVITNCKVVADTGKKHFMFILFMTDDWNFRSWTCGCACWFLLFHLCLNWTCRH